MVWIVLLGVGVQILDLILKGAGLGKEWAKVFSEVVDDKGTGYKWATADTVDVGAKKSCKVLFTVWAPFQSLKV